jgi:hypothetical protein
LLPWSQRHPATFRLVVDEAEAEARSRAVTSRALEAGLELLGQ